MSLERLQQASRQGGWLMPLAAFIIVIMALLVATMSRMGSQSSLSVVQEQLSLQAFYAAESGAQLAMTSLLYPTATRAQAETACTNLANSTMPLNAPGMNNCRVSLQCAFPPDPDDPGIFRVISTGKCGEGNLSANRSIEVGVQVD